VSDGALDFGLAGRTVAVTGASRGIGAACAIACTHAGARRVILLARDVAGLDRVARAIDRIGGPTAVLRCNVTDVDSIDDAFRGVDDLDVLVNSAGTNKPQPFREVRPDTFDDLFAVNVRGAYFVAQAAVDVMRRTGSGGTIITISSQMRFVGAANRSVYCATKHAVERMTKALAVELAAENIRVVSVAPTFVRTDMTAAQRDDPAIGPQLLADIPQGRFGRPEAVASAVVYAASPAAALMTGASLVLDGGWTAR
jgi:NAD(P)-dependent dehydrogenase (short-subunit alcohol dehydrogenase family)